MAPFCHPLRQKTSTRRKKTRPPHSLKGRALRMVCISGMIQMALNLKLFFEN